MKPIIMGAEDVRGILEGRKTMARVPVKRSIVDRFVIDTWGELLGSFTDKFGYYPSIDDCPYQPGGVLWVRETWGDYGGCTGYYVYRADYPRDAKGYWYEKEHINWCDLPDWHSPVSMPREAARLFLRVKDVRVERVQNITVDDAGREGFEGFHHKNPMLGNLPEIVWNFKNEWDARNAKRGHGWDSNPFVWVIEFERIEKGVE